MNAHRGSWRHLVALVLVSSLALLGAPPPVSAEESTPSSVRLNAPLVDSAHRLAAATPLAVATAPPARSQQAQPPAGVDLSKPSFFKSPVGIVVIGVFAAGTAYALYSMSNDRIRGSGR